MVDDTLGMFLCRVVGLLLQVKHALLPRRRVVEKICVKHILIQKYFGMGSMLHAIPLVKALRANYPQARITFVTTAPYREVITLCGLADTVLTMDTRSLASFLLSCARLFVVPCKQRVDISLDLEFFAKFPMLVSALSLAPTRIGLYQRKVRPEGILTHKVHYNFYRHLSEIYLAYATQLELEVHTSPRDQVLPSFRKELESRLRARFQLEAAKKIMIVNVNAGDLFAFRKWPEDHFVKLLGGLLERHPEYNFILIGTSVESAYVDRIISRIGPRANMMNCAGKTTLRELFALIEMADLVITNDSGPLHIASYYGKNIAAFFGPETPVVYGPVNENALVFYSDHLYCSPCMSVYDSKQSLYAETCENNRCLSALLPETVLETIEHRFLAGA